MVRRRTRPVRKRRSGGTRQVVVPERLAAPGKRNVPRWWQFSLADSLAFMLVFAVASVAAHYFLRAQEDANRLARAVFVLCVCTSPLAVLALARFVSSLVSWRNARGDRSSHPSDELE
jgi:hypothetical protein